MGAVTLVKVSKKGQFPIPENIRERMGITPLEDFVAYAGKDFVIFKRVRDLSLSEDFKGLSANIRRKFKKKGIAKEEVGEAIKWARK